jgi:hypothetical protein
VVSLQAADLICFPGYHGMRWIKGFAPAESIDDRSEGKDAVVNRPQ